MAIPAPAFIWGKGGRALTEEEIARERELAEQLKASGVDTSPIGHWTQGAARLAQALVGNMREARADRAAEDNASYNSSLLQSLLGGGSASPAASGSSSSSSAMPMPGAAGEMSAAMPEGNQSYRDAIASIESAGSGDYSAVGPTHPKMGRALGRYQVMEANIGPWSEAALGRAVTPDEFLASPELQDAIFDHQFGQYVQKYGPEGAAQAWFGGPGGVGKTDRKDVLGTTIGGYGQRFMDAIGQTGAQPVEVAGGGGRMGDYGELNPALLQALTDPRASPQTQRVAAMLYEQQMAARRAMQEEEARRARPEYQLELEGKRLSNQKLMRELTGAPDEPDAVRGLRIRAEEAGLQPGTPEYANFFLTQGVRPPANIGAPPAGYQIQYDAAGNPVSMAPIPGSPAALAAEQAASQAASRDEQAATSGGIVVEDIDRAVKTIEGSPNLTTGLIGDWLKNIGGTPANKVRTLTNTIKANAAFDKLQQMRASSPTGGALGAVSDSEMGLLQSAIGSLEQSNRAEDLVYNLRRVQEIYEDIIHGKEGADAMRKARGSGTQDGGAQKRLKFNPATGELE